MCLCSHFRERKDLSSFVRESLKLCSTSDSRSTGSRLTQRPEDAVYWGHQSPLELLGIFMVIPRSAQDLQGYIWTCGWEWGLCGTCGAGNQTWFSETHGFMVRRLAYFVKGIPCLLLMLFWCQGSHTPAFLTVPNTFAGSCLDCESNCFMTIQDPFSLPLSCWHPTFLILVSILYQCSPIVKPAPMMNPDCFSPSVDALPQQTLNGLEPGVCNL